MWYTVKLLDEREKNRNTGRASYPHKSWMSVIQSMTNTWVARSIYIFAAQKKCENLAQQWHIYNFYVNGVYEQVWHAITFQILEGRWWKFSLWNFWGDEWVEWEKLCRASTSPSQKSNTTIIAGMKFLQYILCSLLIDDTGGEVVVVMVKINGFLDLKNK